MSAHDPLSAVKSITLLPGESAEELAYIEQEILKGCDPQTYADRVLVRELVACIWEDLRNRRARDHLIITARIDVVQSRLSKLLVNDPEAREKLGDEAWEKNENMFDPVRELAESYVRGDTRAQENIHYFLKKYKISMEEINAEATALRLEQVTILEKTISEVIRRRDKIIPELDRRKEKREQLRVLAEDIVRSKQ